MLEKLGRAAERFRKQSPRETFFSKQIKPVVKSPLIAKAFQRVDRLNFVPQGQESAAYTDEIIHLKEGSTMSQPSLMAVMLDNLDLKGSERVLEIGTASGYNAALLSLCAAEVHTIEYEAELAEKAQTKLGELGYKNVKVHIGDGAVGVPDQGPFDRIILTAAVSEFPQLLFDQLKDGGVIVAPIGGTQYRQRLAVGRKEGNMLNLQYIGSVSFVSLNTSEHGGWSNEAQAKGKTYETTESGNVLELELQPARAHIDIDRHVDAVGEPSSECLAILAQNNLTAQQFVDMYVGLGKSEFGARVLLTLPDALKFLAPNLIQISSSK